MPINGNSNVTKEFQDTFKIQSIEGTLLNVGTSVQPVYVANPKYNKILRTAVKASTGAGIIYTTSTTAQFYLTNILLSTSQDVTSDQILVTITAVVGGATTVICAISMQPLTASSNHVELVLPFPLLIDKGSNINVVPTFTLGTQTSRGIILGFEI